LTWSKERTVTQNDYGYRLNFKIVDNNGDAIDLSAYTSAQIFVAEEDSSTAKVVGTCTISDPANGLLYYIVQDGDFDVGNKEYKVEIELQGTGIVLTAKGARVYVEPELPESTS